MPSTLWLLLAAVLAANSRQWLCAARPRSGIADKYILSGDEVLRCARGHCALVALYERHPPPRLTDTVLRYAALAADRHTDFTKSKLYGMMQARVVRYRPFPFGRR